MPLYVAPRRRQVVSHCLSCSSKADEEPEEAWCGRDIALRGDVRRATTRMTDTPRREPDTAGCSKGPFHPAAVKPDETAQGGAVSSAGRCGLAARLQDAQQYLGEVPAAVRSLLHGAPWATPPRYTGWHRIPGYDHRRAPCNNPDFTGHAPRGLVQEFLDWSKSLPACILPAAAFPVRGISANRENGTDGRILHRISLRALCQYSRIQAYVKFEHSRLQT